MNTIKNSIELNGRIYDAVTGEALVAEQKSVVVAPSAAAHKPLTGGVVLDAVKPRSKISSTGRGSHHVKPAAGKPAAHTALPTAAPASPVHTVSRRKPERSKTLMRAAVKKPAATPIAEPQPPANKHLTARDGSGLHHHLSAQRVNRAQAVSKSSRISKFSADVAPVTKKTAPLQVRAAPPKPDISRVHAASTQAVVRPDYRSNLLHTALQQADSHQQAPHKRPPLHHRAGHKMGLSNRAATFATGTMIVMLLSSFFAYQNLPNFNMRLAARGAGFAATLPDYRPSGFAMSGPIEHSPGRIVVNFQSTSDNRGYSLTQSPSMLNSQSLLETFLAAEDRAYQTLYDKGKTIYVYEDSNATWVNGGILYEVEGESDLTADQLLRIASSL